MKVVRMVPSEHDGLQTTRNHVFHPITDHTLCGFTLDADRYCVKSEQEIEGKITCEQCWAIIEYCRTIKQKKLADEGKKHSNKELRDHLNEKYGHSNWRNRQCGPQKRKYGDYMWFQDRDMFNALLKDWNQKGETP